MGGDVSKWVRINVNDEARVKPTKDGKETYARRHAESARMFRDLSMLDIRMDGEWYRTQVWSLFNEFGEGMHMTARPQFESNTMWVRVDDDDIVSDEPA